MDKAAVERLSSRSREIRALLKANNQNWEDMTYKVLFKNFGFSVNKYAFTLLSSYLPYKVIAKNRNRSNSTEALLFGVSGFLEDPVDEYQQNLKKEYEYLKHKHGLDKQLSRASWKFGRIRPSNLPTVRIAQLAALIASRSGFFSQLILEKRVENMLKKFEVQLNDYWSVHYDFGKKRKRKYQGIGRSGMENLIINTAAPILFTYSFYTDDQKYKDAAVALLEAVRPEENHIIKKWKSLQQVPKNAFDSQGLIQLYGNYCKLKKCLSCSVGHKILSN